MPKQPKYYRSSRPATPTKEIKPFPWGALTLACLLATGLYMVYGLKTGLFSLSTETPKRNPISQTTDSAGPQSQKTAQRFEFYQLLPGMEVPIDEPIPNNPVLKPKSPPKHAPLPQAKTTPIQRRIAAAQFLIQAGSFRHPEPAFRLQNRLKTEGLISKIQKVEAEDGTWYRVTLGPYATESKALQHKKRLDQKNIHGILILQR